MGRFPRQFRAIATATATEAFQQPAALLLCLTGVYLTALSPIFQLFQFGEPGKLVRDGGLAFTFVLGTILAVAATGTTVHREIEEGTAATVLLRPVGSLFFIAAKTAGVFSLVLVHWVCGISATLLAERVAKRFVMTHSMVGYVSDHRLLLLLLLAPAASLAGAALLNRLFHTRFTLAAFALLLFSLIFVVLLGGFFDRLGTWHIHFNPLLNDRVAPVAVLILAAMLVFAALSAALATRLTTSSVMFAAVAVLVAGVMADVIEARTDLAGLMAWIPNVQHFWIPDVLSKGGSLPGGYLATAAVYALSWSALFLTLGAFSLKTRDLG